MFDAVFLVSLKYFFLKDELKASTNSIQIVTERLNVFMETGMVLSNFCYLLRLPYSQSTKELG